MTDTTSSTPSPYANQALLIVELLERIGSHLTPPDLLACVQVSHHWNSVLVPCLWHTIDDRLYSWSDIITVHINNNASRLSHIIKAEQVAKQAGNNSNGGTDGPLIDDAEALRQRVIEAWPSRRAETLRWIYSVFKKYGRHIRILRVSWPIVIRVAGIAGHCTHLRVLTIDPIIRDTPTRNVEEIRARQIQNEHDRMVWTEDHTEHAADCLWLWRRADVEEEEARQWSKNPHLMDEYPAWLYWGFARRIWILVLRCSTIEHLCLGKRLRTITPSVSPEFVCAILANLPRLKTLDNRFAAIDLQMLLECTSTTRSGNCSTKLFYHSDILMVRLRLDKDFSHLTSLAIRGFVKSTEFLLLLKQLVNLDQLTVGCINVGRDEHPFPLHADDSYEERSRKFPLSGLHLVQFGRDFNETAGAREFLTQRLIPRLPALTELTMEMMTPEIAKALVNHCGQFRAFRYGGRDENISRDTMASVDYDLNIISILLESCPNLTTIDAIQHSIDANYLLEHPWVCEETLETFRCQIVGMGRMTSDDFQAMSLEQGDSGRSIVEEKYRRCQEQHSRVYGRLARLTHLETLDLGGDIQDWVSLIFADGGNEAVIEVNGRMFLELSTPIMDSLEFSLASGLGQLSSLKDLRVFGFEGHDHRIGNKELKWIARHWPKLAVMRGLHIDDSASLVKKDLKTAEQRAYMQRLRPNVIHKAAVLKRDLDEYLESIFQCRNLL